MMDGSRGLEDAERSFCRRGSDALGRSARKAFKKFDKIGMNGCAEVASEVEKQIQAFAPYVPCARPHKPGHA